MQKTRYYTLEEANSLVPILKEKLGRIYKLRASINELDIRIKNLEEFWESELQSDDNPERELHASLKVKHGAITTEVVNILAGLEEEGCLVKDIDEGLVDVFSKHRDQPIFLCWKYGESSISFWHAVDSGFDSRKPVTLLKN